MASLEETPLNTITWLHLSDLGFNGGTTISLGKLTSALLDDVRSLIKTDGIHFDFVAVTGNLISPVIMNRNPYPQAGRWLSHLLQTAGLANNRLFVVPGAEIAAQKPLTTMSAEVPYPNRPTIEDHRRFISQLGGAFFEFPAYETWASCCTFSLGPSRIAVVGINTFHLNDAEEEVDGRPVAEVRSEFLDQLHKAVEKARGADVALALMHQPLDDLRRYSPEAADLLETECDAILHGDAHDLSRLAVRHPRGRPLLLASGRLNGAVIGKQRQGSALSYSIATLDLTHGKYTVYIRKYEEKQQTWEPDEAIAPGGILVMPVVRRTGESGQLPGFAPDTSEGEDRLEISRDVNALAAVLAAKDARPPICVGLFGDWGSGKSFFMQKLEDRVTSLARYSRLGEDDGKQPAFDSHITHIRFNAWHYVDTNLWASLAAHIFEGLAENVGDQQLANLVAQLDATKVILGQAEEEQKQAKNDRQAAEQELQQLQTERMSTVDPRKFAQQAVAALLSTSETQAEIAAAASQIGLVNAIESWDELNAGLAQARSLQGRLRTTILQILASSNRPWLLLAALIVLAIPIVARLLGLAIQYFSGSTISGDLASAFFQIGAFLSWLVLWLNRVLQAGDHAIAALSELRTKALAMVDSAHPEPGIDERTLQERIADLLQREESAKRRLEDANARLAEAQRQIAEIKGIRAPRDLAELILARAKADDYRKHQGVISMLRRDLESLDKSLRAQSQPHGKGSRTPDATCSTENGATQNTTALPCIDRIMLYIDDLDRCPEDKVCDVLQAVHLLLGFELFVVVVGVDSRWLLRSLERYYPMLETPADGGSRRVESSDETWHWTSTPQNYLEKIFQIPFHLRPMTRDGFGALVDSVMPAPAGSTDAPPSVAAPESEPTGDVPAIDEAGVAQATQGAVRLPPEEPIDITPKSLAVEEWEQAYAHELWRFIPTPRETKRFVNIYRLIRAAIPAWDLPTFVGTAEYPGQFRMAMLLLAIQIGFPQLAPLVFRYIHDLDGTTSWQNLVNAIGVRSDRRHRPPQSKNELVAQMSIGEAVHWERLHACLREMSERAPGTQDVMTYKDWLAAVDRYSFRPSVAIG